MKPIISQTDMNIQSYEKNLALEKKFLKNQKENEKIDALAAARVDVIKALIHYMGLTGAIDADKFDDEDIAELADELADLENEFNELFKMPLPNLFTSSLFHELTKNEEKSKKKETEKKLKKNLSDSDIDDIIDSFLKGIGV